MKINKITRTRKQIPGNRIVLKYDFENLVALAKINKLTGLDVPYETFINELYPTFGRIHLYTEYEGMSLAELKSLNLKDKEGFVCQNKITGQRLKVKMEDYVRLHSIITNVTFRDIWKTLRANEPLTTLYENVPDEFYDWVKEKVAFLESEFNKILFEVDSYIERVKNEVGNDAIRRDIAKFIIQNVPKDYIGMVFARLDGSDISDTIWLRLYPPHEKPFSV